MNDQAHMLNQHLVKNHSQFLSKKQSGMITNHSLMLNQLQGQSQMVNQLSHQQPLMVSQNQPQMVNQSKMMGKNSYRQWSQPHSRYIPPSLMNVTKFPNPMNQMYGGIAKPGFGGNWKRKKPTDKRNDKAMTFDDLVQQNRFKGRKFNHPKKKFRRMRPYANAPRNTTSYLIRAKKSGGIASLISPFPDTPAVLPTPVFSPLSEALVDMAKEEWGVDGYGSMKGLIRLRSPGFDEAVGDYEDEDECGSSQSDVEEHVEVERRLDHDLSRFEMIYPNYGIDCHNNVLENRVDDQVTHIAHLEEENVILKGRLYMMESELGELRRRLLSLERQNQVVEEVNEEVVDDNVSDNDSGLEDIRFS